MKTRIVFVMRSALLLILLGAFTGCESTGNGNSSASYYGTTFYDPWHYGYYYYGDGDIIVSPPEGRPEAPARPSQPIYTPDPPRASQMPSIPSSPRPMPRPATRR
jgi:hypothetical protein